MTIYPYVMLSAFIAGLGLIMAIGAQNIFIIKVGLQRKNVFLAATTAATCDISMIVLGTLFMGTLKELVPAILPLIKWSGIIYLMFYSINSFHNAFRKQPKGWAIYNGRESIQEKIKQGVVLPTLAFSLLNPHVYLDTLLILGNIGSQLRHSEQVSFIIGAGAASYLWFYLTGFASKISARFFMNRIAVRVFDILVAITLLVIAWILYSTLLFNS